MGLMRLPQPKENLNVSEGSTIALGEFPPGRPAALAKRPVRRWLAVGFLAVFLLLALAYVGVSAYIADQLTRPLRRAVVGTPADLGMTFEQIAFTSQDG